MRVFISYKSQEREFAIALRERLHEWGYATWLDVEDIPAGTTPDSKGWDDAIHNGMKACQVVVGVLSKASIASPNVRDEWGWALTNKRRLFLLWLEDVPDEDIPPRYERIQRLDFRESRPRGFSRLRQALDSPAKITPTADNHTDSDHPTRRKPPQPFVPYTHKQLTNRQALMQNVYHNWIVGVLEDALHDTEAFTIELDFAQRGAVLKHIDFGDYQLPDTRGIYSLYLDMNRELLILGNPGSGKTILLLQLARDLLAEAQHNDTLPIPAIFNLSSWAVKRDPLEDWLAQQLRVAYQVPKKVGVELVKHGKLALLLDGLDEVAEVYRQDCVEAINAFRRQYHQSTDGHLVVCSRSTEYAALVDKLDMFGAVEVEPLTRAVVQDYVVGPEFEGLRVVLNADSELQTMAYEPLLLNLMALAYQNRSAVSLQLPAGGRRQADIFNRYIEQRLYQGSPLYVPRLARTWLIWLAGQLVSTAQTVFYIEDIQPTWLPNPRRRAYYLVARLIGWSLAAVWGGLLLILGVEPMLGVALVLALAIGLEINGQARGRINHIKPVENQHFRITRPMLVRMGLAWLLMGAIASLVGWFVLKDATILTIGLLGWLVSGMVGALRAGLHTSTDISARSRPNSGIWRSAYHAIQLSELLILGFAFLVGLASLLLVLVGWMTIAPQLAFIYGALSGAAIGLGCALILNFVAAGGPTVIRHIALRMVLWRGGDAPLNYARFLDDMASRKILRKVGGGYIFIHRTLMEHVAALEANTD